MPVHTGQGIGYIILDADAVAAIAGLPVNGVAADADDRLRLEGQGQVVAAGSRPGGEGGAHRVRPCVPAVHAVVLKNQGLMSVFLGPQRTGYIFGTVHHAAALVVEAEHGGHPVSALAGLQGGGRTLRVPDAARAGPRPGGEPGCEL